MLPNVVLPALLEVEDGAWSFTIAVSVIGEVERDDLLRPESTRSKDELMSAGGCISQRLKNAAGLRATTRDNECYSWRPLIVPVLDLQFQIWLPKRRKDGEGVSGAQRWEALSSQQSQMPILKPDLLGPSLG